MYNYVKAFHIIFIVTWFSGLFYVVRLFIYNTEAHAKPGSEAAILTRQFNIMIRRLWYGITWPSAVLTLIFGLWMFYMYGSMPAWLAVKLCFVLGLYLYHFTLHAIAKQQMNGVFKYTSQQLRVWNELATIFLFAIVLLAVVKNNLDFLKAALGLGLLILALWAGIAVYKKARGNE